MAIDGESLKNADFYDDDTNQKITVTLKVKDIIYFRLLEKVISVLARGNA